MKSDNMPSKSIEQKREEARLRKQKSRSDPIVRQRERDQSKQAYHAKNRLVKLEQAAQARVLESLLEHRRLAVQEQASKAIAFDSLVSNVGIGNQRVCGVNSDLVKSFAEVFGNKRDLPTSNDHGTLHGGRDYTADSFERLYEEEEELIDAEYTHHGYGRAYERSISNSKVVKTLAKGTKLINDDSKYPNTHKVIGDEVVVVEPKNTPNLVVTTYWKDDSKERFGDSPSEPKFVVLDGETIEQAMNRLRKEVKDVQVHETGRAVYHLQKKYEKKLEDQEYSMKLHIEDLEKAIETAQWELAHEKLNSDSNKRQLELQLDASDSNSKLLVQRMKDLEAANETLQWQLDCEKHYLDYTKRQQLESASNFEWLAHDEEHTSHDDSEGRKSRKRQRLY